MSIHRRFFKLSVAPGVLVAAWACQPCHAQIESKPIVAVCFDGPYQTVEPSLGDEWAPTWGRDDFLYTGNDDGSSFGGISSNSIAFGKMQGSDPNRLEGTAVNLMPDFCEPDLGPVNAMWKTVSTCKSNGARYTFAPGYSDFAPSGKSQACGCPGLETSTDGGKTWTRPAGGRSGKPMFPGKNFSAPSFISYRKDLKAFPGNDAERYVYAASYAGIVDGQDNYIVGRVLETKLSGMSGSDWSFMRQDGSWTSNPDRASPTPNSSGRGADGANWKTMNSYSVEGSLYMFVTRCLYPANSGDPERRHVFENSSIIKSTDNGKSWTRPAPENFSKPMFPGARFGAPYFVWYGKDGEASVDHADLFVYAVSNNGHFESGDDYILGRVPRAKLPNLRAADWSFYKAGDGMQDGSWTPVISAATPILAAPSQCSMTGMTYIPGLRRYVMVVWRYRASTSFLKSIELKDLGTILDFYEAPKPWGPWTKVKSFYSGKLGWYAPVVGQRFQSAVDASSVKCFLYAAGLCTTATGGINVARYKFNYMPITLSTEPIQYGDPSYVGGR